MEIDFAPFQIARDQLRTGTIGCIEKGVIEKE
jgi:hypothetical protein